LAEKERTMKKTNFARHLEEQLRDPAFAARFEREVTVQGVTRRVP
jgi:hypothetical protein